MTRQDEIKSYNRIKAFHDLLRKRNSKHYWFALCYTSLTNTQKDELLICSRIVNKQGA